MKKRFTEEQIVKMLQEHKEGKTIIEQWRIDYNENRPQRGLNELTPIQFKNTLMNKKTSP